MTELSCRIGKTLANRDTEKEVLQFSTRPPLYRQDLRVPPAIQPSLHASFLRRGIDKRYVLSDTFAVYMTTRTGSSPEDATGLDAYLAKLCYPVERYLIGYAVRNRERLISAIISNALLNEPSGFEQLSTIHVDKSLETIGDFILDFVIIDNFATKERFTAQQIDDFRQWYGNNENLQYFAKNCLHLQKYILWGPDERKQQKWDQPTTVILADRFEMLVAVIYLEKGIDAVKEFLKKHHFFEEIDTIKKP